VQVPLVEWESSTLESLYLLNVNNIYKS
jgi:hypothetical protein